MAEIDLLKNYPKTKRNLEEATKVRTDEVRKVARLFGRDFFDGDRKFGYGGFNYHPKFWTQVVKDFRDYWQLDEKSSILDVGCGKGFMIYDFLKLIPELTIEGIDISEYAIKNSKSEVSNYLKIGDAMNLPYEDKSFDYIISINTIHNLELDDCKIALKEINRVSKKGAFITVDAYNNEEEKKRMYSWNLTAKTILSTGQWKSLFDECDYKGDYYWFIP
tara:strand:+ start:1351 stop:2007 length:657 start_codon:yes stop_codon:yes gene_type:complete